jgi:hypothetical protein
MKQSLERLNSMPMFFHLVSEQNRETLEKLYTSVMCSSDRVEYELRLQIPPQSGGIVSIHQRLLIVLLILIKI